MDYDLRYAPDQREGQMGYLALTHFLCKKVEVAVGVSAMYRYGEVETAIAGLHGASAGDALKTFRSRIKHFQRIGLVPSAPGKGQKIAYTIGQAVQWALCFELAEFNLPPTTIKAIIEQDGYRLRMSFTASPVETEDQYFVIGGSFLTWHFEKNGTAAGPYASQILPLSKLVDLKSPGRALRPDLPRLMLINLTALKRRLGDALKHEWKDDPSAWDDFLREPGVAKA